MTKDKIDRAKLLDLSMNQEKAALSRFDIADKVMSSNPGGLPIIKKPTVMSVGADSTEEECKQIHSIKMELIDDNPFNARHIYNQDKIKDLASSIATQGQKYPVPVVPNPNKPGRYILIDGHYRKRANISLGRSEIECFFENDMPAIELYRISFMLNHERNDQTALDNALAWGNLLKSKVINSEKDLCDLTNISWPKINKTLALLKLSQSTLDLIKEHADKIGVAMGYEIYLYEKEFGELAGNEILQRVINEELTILEVKSIREKASKPKERKQKETSRQYKIASNNHQLGVIKEWDNGKISMDITVDDPVKKAQILESIKKLFEITND